MKVSSECKISELLLIIIYISDISIVESMDLLSRSASFDLSILGYEYS